MDESDVRSAVREYAAQPRAGLSIAEEVGQLAADPDDRAEMRAVREQMAKLAGRAPR